MTSSTGAYADNRTPPIRSLRQNADGRSIRCSERQCLSVGQPSLSPLNIPPGHMGAPVREVGVQDLHTHLGSGNLITLHVTHGDDPRLGSLRVGADSLRLPIIEARIQRAHRRANKLADVRSSLQKLLDHPV